MADKAARLPDLDMIVEMVGEETLVVRKGFKLPGQPCRMIEAQERRDKERDIMPAAGACQYAICALGCWC